SPSKGTEGSSTGAEPVAMAVATMLIAGLLAVVALGSVFLFANRARQRQVVRWTRHGCLILLLSLGLLIITDDRTGAVLSAGDGDLVVATLASLVALGLLQLAYSAVKKDILLVKSMDRIR
ncbi:MAG: DUF4293 family protein, partial [Rhodothermia bacterium]